jgi:hypothetical protein
MRLKVFRFVMNVEVRKLGYIYIKPRRILKCPSRIIAKTNTADDPQSPGCVYQLTEQVDGAHLPTAE